MRTFRRATVVAVALCVASGTYGSAQSAQTFELKQGQAFTVPGTSVLVRTGEVRDFTSQGCEGGPQGCPDRVDLTVVSGRSSQAVTLYVAHTVLQNAQGINRKTLFGAVLVLTGIHLGTITLRAQKAPA